MLKATLISRSFVLICQGICYSVIEETSHVIGKSQSLSEEGMRIDGETEGDEGEVGEGGGGKLNRSGGERG